MPGIALPGILPGAAAKPSTGGNTNHHDSNTNNSLDPTFANAAAADDLEAPPPPSPPTNTWTGTNQAAAADKQKKKKKKRSSDGGSSPSLFPNPKQVVTIFSPIVHTIVQEMDAAGHEPLRTAGSPHGSVLSSYVDGAWRGFTTGAAAPGDTLTTAGATATTAPATTTAAPPAAKRTKKRILKVKMGTLLVKMLNRLVHQKVVAYDRIFLSRNATHLLVRILASERTVPILLLRCERIGVGSVVGAAFGTELEWSMVPNVTEEMQDEAIGRAARSAAGGGGGGGELAGPFSLDKLKFGGGGGGGGILDEDNITGAKEEAAVYEQGFKVTMDKELKDVVKEEEGDEDEEEDEVLSISSEDDVDDTPESSPARNVNTTAKKKSAKAKDAIRTIVAGGNNKKKNSDANDVSEDPMKSTSSATAKAEAVKIGDVEILSSERKAKLGQAIADAREEWLETGSRLRVLQVMESVEAGASLTFDYLAYVLLAAWVAAMGLINNSVAVVVASMLLSPLMGPCLGATLGFTLKKPSLVKLGFANECISLVLCIVVGIFVGAIAVAAGVPSVENWPSDEMTSRGSAYGLVTGMFIAIPSGMGVALSVLGRNSGGLTGVAISLSLLPPAVNAGICWMAAALYRTGAATRNSGDTTDYAFVGSFSLLLTLVNIACIFLGGTFMFKVKEVAPIKNKNTFWSRDVKIARHRRKTIEPNATAIKLGVKAALELEEALAREGNLHTDANTHGHRHRRHQDQMRVAEARRRGLAANVLEDALFVGGGNIIAEEDVVAGGAVDDDILPSESTLRDYVDDLTMDTDKESLLDTAEKVGGLEEAGELLFSDFADMATENVNTTEWDDRLGDYGIAHDDVAGAVLLS